MPYRTARTQRRPESGSAAIGGDRDSRRILLLKPTSPGSAILASSLAADIRAWQTMNAIGGYIPGRLDQQINWFTLAPCLLRRPDLLEERRGSPVTLVWSESPGVFSGPRKLKGENLICGSAIVQSQARRHRQLPTPCDRDATFAITTISASNGKRRKHLSSTDRSLHGETTH